MKSIYKGSIPNELYQSNVVLYGAGMSCRRILKLLEPYKVNIQYIIDDDSNKWGDKIENIEVISYKDFERLCGCSSHILVILTSIYGKAILKRLKDMIDIYGVEVYEMYEWFNEAYGFQGFINGIDSKKEIKKFHWEIQLLADKFSDAESKKVLYGIDEYLHSGNADILNEICTEEEQYFIPEVLAAIHQPLNLVDGGAYVGELYQSIRKKNIQLEHWYCFEADINNYNQLLQQSERLGLGGIQVCINKGLWNQEGNLFFDGNNDTISKIVEYETNNRIETITLDTYLKNRNCNFIKMDIEGAEYYALRGGIGVIKRDRPILAISIYHSVEDFYKIPNYLIDFLKNYNFYIRHHALLLCETVLYAIPKELTQN